MVQGDWDLDDRSQQLGEGHNIICPIVHSLEADGSRARLKYTCKVSKYVRSDKNG